MDPIILKKDLYCGDDCFTLVFLAKGSTQMSLGKRRVFLAAPAVLCLNEKENPEFSNSCKIKAQSVFFYPSHINSSLSFDNLAGDKSLLSESAVLDRYFLRPFVERDETFYGCFQPGPNTELDIARKISRLSHDVEDIKSPFHPCRTRSSLIDLLMLIGSCYRDDTESLIVGEDSLVARIVSHITAHYDERITVQDVCGVFDTNRNTLSKKFRESTGHTLIEYLSRIRINMASRLLRETSLPAGDILYRVGFNDPAHFTRTFRKVTGFSPSAYRDSFRKK